MIRVSRQKIRPREIKNFPFEIASKRGEWFFVLNYRKGAMYFRNYPDRSQYTHDKFLKKCYQLDDQLYFLDALNKKQFFEARDQLINDILEFAFEQKEKAEKYPETVPAYFHFIRRYEALKFWAEKLLEVEFYYSTKKALKKIKKVKLMLW